MFPTVCLRARACSGQRPQTGKHHSVWLPLVSLLAEGGKVHSRLEGEKSSWAGPRRKVLITIQCTERWGAVFLTGATAWAKAE